MQKVQDFVLECDFFSHGNLHRYKEEQSYRTIIGGVVSIILVIFFFSIFFNLTISTFKKEIINSSVTTIFEDNPSKLSMVTDPSKKFMFAVGITGIDFRDSQRYFDILLKNRKYEKKGSATIKTESIVPLKSCTEEQWSGITETIKSNFQTQQFQKWLCPSTGQEFFLEGKFTSSIFQFSQLIVQPCTQNNTQFPGTVCRSSTEVDSLQSTLGDFTLNFYFVNTIINPAETKYLDYYLEDRNYFTFTTQYGVSSNIFFRNYELTTDTSFFPWSENKVQSGFVSQQVTDYKSYPTSSTNKKYIQMYLRKSPQKNSVNRSLQKLDQTFSYIGGLFGTIILLLLFLNFYSKYCYELEFGDKLFRETEQSSFGSENFNFIVFFGYCIFNICDILGIQLRWQRMKRYHQCRLQVQKQLNIDLLYRKLAHFDEVAEIILEEHQLKMLLMTPKPTLEQARLNRKRFQVKSIIYHQLEKKAHYVQIQPDIFQKRLSTFLDQQTKHLQLIKFEQKQKTIKKIKQQLVTSYSKLKKQSKTKNPFTEKILSKLKLDQIKKTNLEFIDNIFKRENNQLKKDLEKEKEQDNMSAGQSSINMRTYYDTNEGLEIQFKPTNHFRQ